MSGEEVKERETACEDLVVEELDALCTAFSKKHDRGGSFRPFRYYRNREGANEPVFFVGVPGLSVAISMTVVVLAVVTLATTNASWYAWLILAVLGMMVIWFSQKVDTARQVRFLSFSLSAQAVRMIRKACVSEDAAEKKELMTKASELLAHASKAVMEPSIDEQKERVDDWLNNN